MGSKPVVQETLFATGHRTRLGLLGERLAIELLRASKFDSVRNLNELHHNNIFADVAAERGGQAYIISVKTRNRLTDRGALNASYNLLKIDSYKNRKLKNIGLSSDDITLKLYQELAQISVREDAIPAWVALSVDAATATFSAYFGMVGDLRGKRSIPMTAIACAGYEALALNRYGARITADLSNARDQNSN